MKRGLLLGVLLAVAVAVILTILFFPKTGFAVQPLSASHLEELRLKAEAGCLQNSQCPEGSECLNNACVNKNQIDVCQEISLSTTVKSLQIGDSINSARKTLSESDLPYLLTDGKIVEVIEGKLVEHLYSPSLLIGTSKIEKENGDYLIGDNEPIYIYRLFFFRGIDFSSKNIRGQVLRILGQEYVIGSNSDNSNIYLVSTERNVLLQNKDNVKITKDENGNVYLIEITFSAPDKITVDNAFIEPTFNVIKLSFSSVDEFNSADVKVGGDCL